MTLLLECKNPYYTQKRMPLMTYPFPIRFQQIAKVVVPCDMTKREAQRLIRYIESLVQEDE